MDQCYFNGEFYQCATAAAPGETPATAPTKWRRIQIPKAWRGVLTQLTYAHLLQIDGQTDKSLVELRAGQGALDDLVRQAANAERWRQRPNVRTPGGPC